MSGVANTIRFSVQDVTGTMTLEASDVQATLPAGAVARSVASKMGLPQDVPWALRSDRTSVYLDDEVAIGDQIDSEGSMSIVPLTHLGGGKS